MNKIKIYTKVGDRGRTALLNGKKVSKSHPRVEVYGEVDELNSHVGCLAALLINDVRNTQSISILRQVQSCLHVLASQLACPPGERKKFKLPSLPENITTLLEVEIDLMDNELPQLQHFVLPGGHIHASYSHICRSICRRLERKLVNLAVSKKGEVPPENLSFVNRLSDYFFVLARWLNHQNGVEEKQWPEESGICN
ncbi:MAG: cob(I)yrinic acid a,c-diamide adenosyltransferase [Pseudomonadota bacterium]